MRSFRTGKVLGADRIAVMAALQIAQELYSARSSDGAPWSRYGASCASSTTWLTRCWLPQEKLF